EIEAERVQRLAGCWEGAAGHSTARIHLRAVGPAVVIKRPLPRRWLAVCIPHIYHGLRVSRHYAASERLGRYRFQHGVQAGAVQIPIGHLAVLGGKLGSNRVADRFAVDNSLPEEDDFACASTLKGLLCAQGSRVARTAQYVIG